MDIFLSILGLLGFIALTAGTGLFVAIEFAITGLERSTIDAHVKAKNDKPARLTRDAHSELSLVLSGAQLGITITTLATGYLAEPILAKFFTPILDLAGVPHSASMAIALVLSIIVATTLSMIFGELVPKNLAITNPLDVARWAIRPVWVFNRIFRGFILFLNNTANFIVRKFGIEPADELASARSPKELAALVKNSTGTGGFTQAKARILERSLRFSNLSAEDIMTPRSTVESLDENDTAVDLIEVAMNTGHSRFPVTRGDLDETIGVVHVKDAVEISPDRLSQTAVKRLARPVPTIPDSLAGDAVLNHVRSAGSQLVLVADEYGGTSGIITIEDVVEEIIGAVWDEYDNEGEDAEVRKTGQFWEMSGLVRIDEVFDAVGYTAPDGPYETLGGLVMATLGAIPAEGDEVVLPRSEREARDTFESGLDSRWIARVLSMDNHRIEWVLLRPVTESAARAAETALRKKEA